MKLCYLIVIVTLCSYVTFLYLCYINVLHQANIIILCYHMYVHIH